MEEAKWVRTMNKAAATILNIRRRVDMPTELKDVESM